MLFKPWWEFWKSWLATLRRVPKRLALGDIRRWLEERRLRRPARSWIKQVHLQLEVLEERRLFAGNVYLPGQLVPTDGAAQANVAVQLLRPATASLMPSQGLQSTTVASAAQTSFSDSGGYSLSLLQAGAYDNNGDRYTFQASGNVTFSLTEQGSLNNSGFTVSNMTLSETGKLTWSMTETNSSGQTVQALSGNATFVATNNGAQPMDGFFPGGFDWYYEMLAVSNANNLGLNNLAADTVSVQETNGSENYELQETGGIATVQGNVRQPLSSVLDQTGQQSYQDTAVEQFSDTEEGADSFILSELGTAAGNGQYNFTNVNYQETGSNTHVFNATVTDSRSGTITGSGAQSFSGNNHSLGASSAETYNFSSLSTSVYGETAASNYTLTESGSYANGCFNLNSLVYQNDGSGSSALTQTAQQTQTGNFNANASASGANSFGVAGTLGDSGSATSGGAFTATSNSTLLDDESGAFTLTEQGSYANESWALSSFNLSESQSGTFSQQQVGTTTQSGTATSTSSGSATDSYALGYGSSNTTSATQSASSTNTSVQSFSLTAVSSSTQSGASSYTLSELGSMQGGIVTLSDYAFTSGQSGTWSAGVQSNQTVSGTSQASVSGSGSGNQCASAGSVSLNLLGGGSYSGSAGYSFTGTDSMQSSDGGSFGQSTYLSGQYGNGSWSLSSVALASTWSDNGSSVDNSTLTAVGTNNFSNSGTGSNSGTFVFSQGTMTNQGGGSYSNSGGGSFSNTASNSVSSSWSSQYTFTRQGSYANDSFSFGSVNYQAGGTSNTTLLLTSDNSFSNNSQGSWSNSGNATSGLSWSDGTGSGLQSANGSGSSSMSASGSTTLTETMAYTDVWNYSAQGCFVGGSWALASVTSSDSVTSGFTLTQIDGSSYSGSDTYLNAGSVSDGATTVYGGGSWTGADTVSGTIGGSDSFSGTAGDTITQVGVDTWQTTQQGVFGQESFAFASLVQQGGDSFTETIQAWSSATSSGSATAAQSVQVQNNSLGTYGPANLSSTATTGGSSNDSYQTGGSSSFSQTVSIARVDGYYNAGAWSGGSLALSSVSYGETINESWSSSSLATSTSSGSNTFSGGGGGSDSGTFVYGGQTATGQNGGNYSNSGSGNFSDTATQSFTTSGSAQFVVSRQGTYGNDSYSFGTAVYQANGTSNLTVLYTDASSFSNSIQGTWSNGASGTVNGSWSLGTTSAGQSSTGSGTYSMGLQGNTTLTQTVTSADSWNAYSLGSSVAGSWALSSVSYGDSVSGGFTLTRTDAATNSGSQSFTNSGTVNDGAAFLYGGASVSSGNTVTGTQSGSSSFSGSAGDTVTAVGVNTFLMTEQGTYGNWSYSLSCVVYQGGDSMTETVLSSGTASSSGSETATAGVQGQNSSLGTYGPLSLSGSASQDGSSSASFQAGSSASYGQTYTLASVDAYYRSGAWSGGSLALSSVSFSGTMNESWSSAGQYTATSSGSSSFNVSGNGSSNGTLAYGGNQGGRT
jgi:hypothetical protein